MWLTQVQINFLWDRLGSHITKMFSWMLSSVHCPLYALSSSSVEVFSSHLWRQEAELGIHLEHGQVETQRQKGCVAFITHFNMKHPALQIR